MEGVASVCSQTDALGGPEENLSDFVKKFEADGWPLLYALWDLSRLRTSDGVRESHSKRAALHQMFADNTGAPHCVADRYPVEIGTGDQDELRKGSKTSLVAHVADIPYIHIILSMPVSVSEVEREMIAALDALDRRGVFHWESKLLFPFLNETLVKEIRRRAELQGGKTLCGPLVRIYSFDSSSIGDDAVSSARQQASQVPEGLFAGQPDDHDAAVINAEWKFGRSLRSLHDIANTIKSSAAGFAVGIYRAKSSSANGKDGASESAAADPRSKGGSVARRRSLVAWGMVNTYGGIGMLQTLPAYQRRGLAQVIIHRLVAALCQESLPVFAVIEVDNPQSQRCFQKAGFRVVPGLERQWVHYFPPGMQPA